MFITCHRKGLVGFVSKRFPSKREEICKLERSAVGWGAGRGAGRGGGQLGGEARVSTYLLPLRGDENSFSYKSDTCEYILQAAVGKEQRAKAR